MKHVFIVFIIKIIQVLHSQCFHTILPPVEHQRLVDEDCIKVWSSKDLLSGGQSGTLGIPDVSADPDEADEPGEEHPGVPVQVQQGGGGGTLEEQSVWDVELIDLKNTLKYLNPMIHEFFLLTFYKNLPYQKLLLHT